MRPVPASDTIFRGGRVPRMPGTFQHQQGALPQQCTPRSAKGKEEMSCGGVPVRPRTALYGNVRQLTA